MPTLIFTNGDDSYTVSAAGTYDLSFLAGADLLTVNGGTFTIAHMGDDNDVVILRAGDASVFGVLGNDRFEIYAAGIEADGGDGDDIFNIRGAANVTLAGGDGADRFNFAGDTAGVVLHGDLGDDNFAGFNLAIGGSIYGDAGNDTFTGFRAGAALAGGLGNDVYRVNPLSNATFLELAGEGSDTVQLMRGADFTLPDNVERVIVGTYAGSDTSTATITGNALGNAFTGHGNDETVHGLGGVDRLYGKNGNDSLYGGDDNDLLDGGAGNDIMDGGAGNDQLVGRSGDDIMSGGAGNDIYYIDSAADQTIEALGEGTDTVRTALGSTTLADNIENGVIMTGTGATLAGNAGANLLYGNAGADILQGLAGNDDLRGAGGNDVLDGAEGDDVFSGGAGADFQNGGAGADTFRFNSHTDSTPNAVDFLVGWDDSVGSTNDIIDLSAIDANTTVDGNQAFSWGPGPQGAGSLWYDVAGSGEFTIYGDVDGDNVADMQISVQGLYFDFFTDVLF